MVKRVVLHPVLNGSDPIDIDVRYMINFNGVTLEHVHLAKNSRDVIYEIEFDLPDEYYLEGKLWAFDRRHPGRCFSISSYVDSVRDRDILEITIRMHRPCIYWSLRVH